MTSSGNGPSPGGRMMVARMNWPGSVDGISHTCRRDCLPSSSWGPGIETIGPPILAEDKATPTTRRIRHLGTVGKSFRTHRLRGSLPFRYGAIASCYSWYAGRRPPEAQVAKSGHVLQPRRFLANVTNTAGGKSARRKLGCAHRLRLDFLP